MTREEAVKEIEKAFEPAFANYIITALIDGTTVSDKEPTTKNDLGVDYISRADALRVAKNEYLRGWHNALCKALSEKYSIHCEEGNFSVIQEETITGLGLSMNCALGKDVESYMSTMSSVTPQEPRWIPVSERLPKDNENVLVSVIATNEKDYFRVGDAWYQPPNGCRGEWKNLMICEEVVAWMPLPKPYKPTDSNCVRVAIEALECMKKIKTLIEMDNEQHTRSIKLSELKEVCGL